MLSLDGRFHQTRVAGGVFVLQVFTQVCLVAAGAVEDDSSSQSCMRKQAKCEELLQVPAVKVWCWSCVHRWKNRFTPCTGNMLLVHVWTYRTQNTVIFFSNHCDFFMVIVRLIVKETCGICVKEYGVNILKEIFEEPELLTLRNPSLQPAAEYFWDWLMMSLVRCLLLCGIIFCCGSSSSCVDNVQFNWCVVCWFYFPHLLLNWLKNKLKCLAVLFYLILI